MPSEPRTEPTLDELSAYLDHELDAGDQARVAEHVATCSDCQSRLDGLRQTAYAVRALPQETPPRAFTIPQMRSQQWNWAPAGWIGGVAAALVIVIVGVTHIPSGGSTASSSTASGGLGVAAPYTQQYAPAARSGGTQEQSSTAAKSAMAAFSNSATVTDPTNSARKLVLGSDSASYATSWPMAVRIVLQGDPSPSIDANAQGLTLVLVRNGSGVTLRNLTGTRAHGGPPVFTASYAISALPLTQPVPGNYTLIATWTVPDGSGRVLQASVPITIVAS